MRISMGRPNESNSMIADADSIDLTEEIDSGTEYSNDSSSPPPNLPWNRTESPAMMCITLTDTDSESDEDGSARTEPQTDSGRILSSESKTNVNSRKVSTFAHKLYPIKCRWKCPCLFESRNAMMYHVRTYHRRGVQKTFECHLCKSTLCGRGALLEHMNSRHSHRKCFICPHSMCSQIFYRELSLQQHLKFLHSKRPIAEKSWRCKAANQPSRCSYPVKCAWQSCHNCFESEDAMMYHVARYHAKGSKRIYECHLCRRTLCSRVYLLKHMSSIHLRRILTCPIKACTRIFHRKDMLRRHLKYVHPRSEQTFAPIELNDPHIRPEQAKQIDSTGRKKQLPNVVKRRNEKKFRVKCVFPPCKDLFENKRAAIYHLEQFHARGIKRTYECHLCGKETKYRRDNQMHFNEKHSHRISFTCPFSHCSRVFYDIVRLRYHRKNDHIKNGKPVSPGRNIHLANSNVVDEWNNHEFPVKCLWSQCRHFLENTDAALYHGVGFHRKGSERSFECHLCKITLRNEKSTQMHMNAKHSHRKKLKCTFSGCPQIFYHEDTLKSHMKRYHSRKTVPSDRNSHSADIGVDDERNNHNFPVKCGWRSCSERFDSTNAMMYHLSTYHRTGIKRTSECHLCRRKFALKEVFVQHMNALHTRQQQFVCPISSCALIFYRKNSLERHLKCIHPGHTMP